MSHHADPSETPLTTAELIELAQAQPQHWLEAGLILKTPFLAVHFLCFDGKKLWDEGIDGERRKLRPEQFAAEYEGQFWVLQQVV